MRFNTAMALLVCVMAPARAQLTERGKAAGSDLARGSSVALSGDGSTLIEGGPEADQGRGAAWVFSGEGDGWSAQGGKLSAPDAVGERVSFGRAVSISADGNTALIGGAGDSDGMGAAWVFTRAQGVWIEQAKLTGADGKAKFGSAVALSEDGNTAIVGGAGAVWIFVRENGAWRQQGEKLMGSGAIGAASQGHAVAISADGNTALIGGPLDNQNRGAAWIFTRIGEVWTQQGSKLAGTAESLLGASVALSGDGGVAIAGGCGAAWEFVRSDGEWVHRGDKLSITGDSLALSADGDRLIAGAPGSGVGAWEFDRIDGAWKQTARLFGSGAAQQGFAVAISADRHTAASAGIGAVWTFGEPVVTVSGPGATVAGETVNYSIEARDGRGRIVSNYAGAMELSSSDGKESCRLACSSRAERQRSQLLSRRRDCRRSARGTI
jgi:hypothetical protein